MDESTLLLEVGSEALSELTTDEKSAILNRYTNTQVKFAGMKTFDVLRKKFQPNYRMGRMYESLSQKFEFYNRMYTQYARDIRAGKLGHTDYGEKKSIDPDKFRQSEDDLEDI